MCRRAPSSAFASYGCNAYSNLEKEIGNEEHDSDK